MLDWDKIRTAVNKIATDEMVNRIDIIKGKLIVYSVGPQSNPKAIIRIDIKTEREEKQYGTGR
jgi:hypothetical protein